MPRLPPFLLVALVAAAAGYGTAHLWNSRVSDSGSPGSVTGAPSLLVGETRPDFALPGLSGQTVAADDFSGSVLLVNFWATWCEPCRIEMPMLQKLQTQWEARGLRIVGVALDDEDRVREFAADLGISYTVLVGGAEAMKMGQDWGNHGGLLPYSVLVDRDGVVRWAALGELEEPELRRKIEALF